MQPREHLRSYGRRHGRKLPEYKQSLADGLLREISIKGSNPYEPVNPELPANSFAEGEQIDLPALIPNRAKWVLEIGYGSGEHLAHLAAAHPDWGFIGAEPYMNGVANLLVTIAQQNLQNIRLFSDDVRLLFPRLPEQCLDSIYILFPDPWPKARHNKRRLINSELLAALARLQKPGAELLMATDHVDYGAWILEVLLSCPHYRWAAESQADWQTSPAEWLATRYQHKTTLEGRNPAFFRAERV